MRMRFPAWFGVVALVFATELVAAEFGSKGRARARQHRRDCRSPSRGSLRSGVADQASAPPRAARRAISPWGSGSPASQRLPWTAAAWGFPDTRRMRPGGFSDAEERSHGDGPNVSNLRVAYLPCTAVARPSRGSQPLGPSVQVGSPRAALRSNARLGIGEFHARSIGWHVA